MISIGDAGHGGKDLGAISKDKKVFEKDLALATTLRVRELILPHLPETHLTRDDDRFLTLTERARRANALGAVLWSVHYNAGGGRGIEVFTSPGQTKSDGFATAVLEEMDKVSDQPMRLDWSDGDPDKEARFTVLTKTQGPAILIEVGFMDNAKDLEYITDPVNHEGLCRGIARGILRFAGLSASLIKPSEESLVEAVMGPEPTIEEVLGNILWQVDRIEEACNDHPTLRQYIKAIRWQAQRLNS